MVKTRRAGIHHRHRLAAPRTCNNINTNNNNDDENRKPRARVVHTCSTPPAVIGMILYLQESSVVGRRVCAQNREGSLCGGGWVVGRKRS